MITQCVGVAIALPRWLQRGKDLLKRSTLGCVDTCGALWQSFSVPEVQFVKAVGPKTYGDVLPRFIRKEHWTGNALADRDVWCSASCAVTGS
eukprot:3690305-Amphidinium_carterae.2